MRTHLLDYVLWCTTPMVMIVIAAYMLRGRLQRDFPFFFNYVVFQIASFAVEFPLRDWVNYYYVYWVIQALSIFVTLAVLLEIVLEIVGKPITRRDRNIVLLLWCALSVMAVALAWAIIFGGGNGIDNLTNTIFLVDRSVRIATCALAVVIVLFGAAIGVSKRNLVFGIVIGFGFAALVNLVVMTSLSHQSFLSKMTLSRISAFSYLISMLIWLAYVAVAAKTDSSSQPAGPA